MDHLDAPNRLERLGRWLRLHGRSVFLSWDAALGALTAAFTGGWLYRYENWRSSAEIVLRYEVTLGIAAVSVGLASLALLAGMLDRTMTLALLVAPDESDDHGGNAIDDLVTPFRSMTVVGAATALAAAVTMTIPADQWRVVTVASAVSAGLAVWTAVGIVQLVGIMGELVRMKGARYEIELELEHDLTARRQARQRESDPDNGRDADQR